MPNEQTRFTFDAAHWMCELEQDAPLDPGERDALRDWLAQSNQNVASFREHLRDWCEASTIVYPLYRNTAAYRRLMFEAMLILRDVVPSFPLLPKVTRAISPVCFRPPRAAARREL